MVNVLFHDDFVVSVIPDNDFHVGVFRFLRSICPVVALRIVCAFVFELLCNVRCVHKRSLSDCGTEIAVADLIFGCFFQVNCNAFSILVCCKSQYVSDQVSGCIPLLHVVLCFWSSHKGECMGCLSNHGRIVIRHFHRDACRNPCARLKGQCRCIDALPFCSQLI